MKKDKLLYYKMPVYLHGKETGYTIDANLIVRNKDGKIMKLNVAATGYLTFAISHNGKKTRKSHHRAVAEAFIPNPDNKEFVNHEDGNKQNNDPSNLTWTTPAENNEHARRTGLTTHKLPTGKGDKNPRSEHSERLIRYICELIDEGKTNISISKETGVSYNVIKQIRNGYTWTHVSKDYNFMNK